MNGSRLVRHACSWAAARPRIRPYRGWTTGAGLYGRRRPANVARRRLFEALDQPVEIRWLEGLRICLQPGNETSRIIFVTGFYEPMEFHWLTRFLESGMGVVDAGANMGLYTMFCARKVGEAGRVLALEPSTREFEQLEQHVTRNALAQVRCCKVAIGRQPARGKLQVATVAAAGHNTLGAFAYETTELETVEEVEIRPLDELVEKARMPRVDFLKLDVEGAEYDALLGARRTLEKHRPAILLEVADRTLRHQGVSSARVWDLLGDLGYQLYAFDRRGRLVPAVRKVIYDSEDLVALAGTGSEHGGALA